MFWVSSFFLFIFSLLYLYPLYLLCSFGDALVSHDLFPGFSISSVVSLCVFFNASIFIFKSWNFCSSPWPIQLCFFCISLRDLFF